MYPRAVSRRLTRRDIPLLWRDLTALLYDVTAHLLSPPPHHLQPAAASAGVADYSVRRSGDDAPQTPAERKLAEYARRSREQSPRSDGAQEPQPVDQPRQESPSSAPVPTEEDRQPETPSTPPAPPQPPQGLPNIDDERPLSRLLSGRLRADDGRIIESISERLRSLKDQSIEDEGGRPSAEPVAHTPRPAPPAELVFTAGPRAGERFEIGERRLALDRQAREVTDADAPGVVLSIWAQGPRFMLRDGGVLVGGTRPAMPVVTLEDGDELAWGEHRLRFRIEESP